ncbi:hypothetical protein [Pseudomonas kitaguniensis]|uniref:hypothetical protein n=1 Tax=Pseudomonas kitaguniensis TaxID=2607908 RepID=UPI001F4F1DC5|nr:hypothetical protein [Pseudomonas kitaguniensis]
MESAEKLLKRRLKIPSALHCVGMCAKQMELCAVLLLNLLSRGSAGLGLKSAVMYWVSAFTGAMQAPHTTLVKPAAIAERFTVLRFIFITHLSGQKP